MVGAVLFSLSKALVSSSRKVVGYILFALSFCKVGRPSATGLCQFVKPPLSRDFRECCKFSRRGTCRTIRGCQRQCGAAKVFRYGLCPNIRGYVHALGRRKCQVNVTSSGPRMSYEQVLRRFKVLPLFSSIMNTAFSNAQSGGSRVLGRIVHH